MRARIDQIMQKQFNVIDADEELRTVLTTLAPGSGVGLMPVVEKLAAKYHLPLVRYQDVFDAASQKAPPYHWSWDGVHPTYAGHWLMTQAWLQTANTFWSKS